MPKSIKKGGLKCKGKVNLDLRFCLSNDGFSLDELVESLKGNFEEKAFSELLRLILLLVQEVLVGRSLNGNSLPFECCRESDLRLNGNYTSPKSSELCPAGGSTAPKIAEQVAFSVSYWV